MDFEWQTRAPGDVTSPFYQLGLQRDNQKKCQLKTLVCGWLQENITN